MMIKIDDKKTLIASLAISLLILAGGVFHQLSQWEYYESGQGILLVIYLVACFGLFFALRFSNITQIIASFVLLALVTFYADQKFEWRKNYIQNSQNGKPFILEPYIQAYPLFEEHHFGGILDKPAWINFSADCLTPALSGTEVPKICRSEGRIKSEYNIDPIALVNTHFKRMKRTAQRIETGAMKNKRQYQACLRNKTCAIIPLLPKNVDADAIDRQSDQHIGTRKMFWSLMNDAKISPEVCEYMDLCRALRDLNVMPIAKPQ